MVSSLSSPRGSANRADESHNRRTLSSHQDIPNGWHPERPSGASWTPYNHCNTLSLWSGGSDTINRVLQAVLLIAPGPFSISSRSRGLVLCENIVCIFHTHYTIAYQPPLRTPVHQGKPIRVMAINYLFYLPARVIEGISCNNGKPSVNYMPHFETAEMSHLCIKSAILWLIELDAQNSYKSNSVLSGAATRHNSSRSHDLGATSMAKSTHRRFP
ncbi:hypothetical protein BKA70DRAFT_1538202 [Coprinopsis sp. MPI-PUGE-AT-0042]|nr:hypothetical protein BKA70DRAFT_1538202 [Coprinopsis sp. MPI-PUGE-AT-0042]